MKLRDIIPLSFGVVAWLVSLIIFQFTLFQNLDEKVLVLVSSYLFLPIIMGSIVYVVPLFITYMAVDPNEWYRG